MTRTLLTIVAVILIASTVVLLVEWDFQKDIDCTCVKEIITNEHHNTDAVIANPTTASVPSTAPSICPPCTCEESTSAPFEDPDCMMQEQSVIEQVCYDPQVSVEQIQTSLSMDVRIPNRTTEQKVGLAGDEHRFISHREVVWINGSPFVVPPEVLRIDTYNVGPGKRASIRFAHWNHECNTWYNTKLNLTSSWINPGELDKWAAMIRPGSVAIDIGAHVGDTTVPIAVAAEMTIAFEPLKSVYPVTWTNGIVNPLLNIHTHNLAVGADSAKLAWSYDCNGGASSITALPPFDVTMVVLYDFLKENYPLEVIKNISFIKIDTEGYDLDVVQTLGPLLEVTAEKPIIFLEWFLEHEFDLDVRKRFQKLADALGFVIFSPTGVRVADMETAEFSRDLVFIPKEKEAFWASGRRMQPTSKPSHPLKSDQTPA